MTKQRPLLALALTSASLLLFYRTRIRSWMYAWGATVEECGGALPGDELVSQGRTRTTRAIDVAAPVEAVWPWLAQLGENRGGFYSYSVLERAVGANVHNANTVHEEWQDLHVGDDVWLAKRYGEHACQVVADVQPKSHLVLVSKDDFHRIESGERASGSWSFVLRSTATGTRLLVRGSGDWFGHALFDIPHFVMERKMLKGIRRRAERLGEPLR